MDSLTRFIDQLSWAYPQIEDCRMNKRAFLDTAFAAGALPGLADAAPLAADDGARGLRPLWVVYDADRLPEMGAQPLTARFGACPWTLYHIAVQA
jgi:hypothetical protein